MSCCELIHLDIFLNILDQDVAFPELNLFLKTTANYSSIKGTSHDFYINVFCNFLYHLGLDTSNKSMRQIKIDI